MASYGVTLRRAVVLKSRTQGYPNLPEKDAEETSRILEERSPRRAGDGVELSRRSPEKAPSHGRAVLKARQNDDERGHVRKTVLKPAVELLDRDEADQDAKSKKIRLLSRAQLLPKDAALERQEAGARLVPRGSLQSRDEVEEGKAAATASQLKASNRPLARSQDEAAAAADSTNAPASSSAAASKQPRPGNRRIVLVRRRVVAPATSTSTNSTGTANATATATATARPVVRLTKKIDLQPAGRGKGVVELKKRRQLREEAARGSDAPKRRLLKPRRETRSSSESMDFQRLPEDDDEDEDEAFEEPEEEDYVDDDDDEAEVEAPFTAEDTEAFIHQVWQSVEDNIDNEGHDIEGGNRDGEGDNSDERVSTAERPDKDAITVSATNNDLSEEGADERAAIAADGGAEDSSDNNDDERNASDRGDVVAADDDDEVDDDDQSSEELRVSEESDIVPHEAAKGQKRKIRLVRRSQVRQSTQPAPQDVSEQEQEPRARRRVRVRRKVVPEESADAVSEGRSPTPPSPPPPKRAVLKQAEASGSRPVNLKPNKEQELGSEHEVRPKVQLKARRSLQVVLTKASPSQSGEENDPADEEASQRKTTRTSTAALKASESGKSPAATKAKVAGATKAVSGKSMLVRAGSKTQVKMQAATSPLRATKEQRRGPLVSFLLSGHKVVKVPRELILSKPETKLAQLLQGKGDADDVERMEKQAPSSPFILEMSRDCFSCILDWYRYGEMSRTSTVSTHELGSAARALLLPEEVIVNGKKRKTAATPAVKVANDLVEDVIHKWKGFGGFFAKLLEDVEAHFKVMSDMKLDKDLPDLSLDEFVLPLWTEEGQTGVWLDASNVGSGARARALALRLEEKGCNCSFSDTALHVRR